MYIAVIPAKGTSRRLKNKNMRIIFNQPLINYTFKYAKKSKIIKKIFISSDSEKVLRWAKKNSVGVIKRPKRLCGETPIIDVYKHAYNILKKRNKISAIVGLQPDHPDRKKNIDTVLKKFKKNKVDFLYSLDAKKNKNGAHYIIHKKILSGKEIRKKCFIIDDCTSIHTKNDLKKAKRNLEK